MFEVASARRVNRQAAAIASELVHPGGNLDALVDALRRPVKLAVPVDRLGARPVGRGNSEIDRIDGRTGLVPEVQLELAFVLKGRVEHALARQNLALRNLLLVAILNDFDVVTFLAHQTDTELQSRLPAAYDDDPTLTSHHILLVLEVGQFSPSEAVSRPRRAPGPSLCSRHRRAGPFR